MMNDRGYTLMEILIAMVILMVAFVAIMAVQTSSLQGYISARDNTDAAELGRRVTEVLTVEALQWDGLAMSYAGSAAYSSGSQPFSATTTPIADVFSNEWTWQSLYTSPVDPQMAGLDDDSDHIGGKFCAFVRGGEMEVDLDQDDDGTNEFESFTPALQLNVAVVYPGPHATLASCDDVPTGDLDTASDTYPGESLEAQGLRVQHFATIVQPRPEL